MSRTYTPRERWMLTMLPATLVLIGYVYVYQRPVGTALGETQNRLAALRADAVTPRQLSVKRQSNMQLEDRVDILTRQTGGVAAGGDGGALTEAQALAQITNALEKRNVVVASSSRLSASDALHVMPAEIADSLRRGGEAALRRGVWRVQATGVFNDVCGSLDAIAAPGTSMIPLGIAMEPSDDGQGAHQWTLWILM